LLVKVLKKKIPRKFIEQVILW